MARANAWNKIAGTIVILLALLPLAGGVTFGQQGKLIENPLGRIPRWVRDAFFSEHLDNRYTIIYQLYPTFLKGDFNGDGRRDIAIQVKENRSGKMGIAVFHAKRPQALAVHVVILGAGTQLAGAGDDFKWVNVWRIGSPPGAPTASGRNGLVHQAALRLEKRNGMKGVIYWTGKRYEWVRVRS